MSAVGSEAWIEHQVAATATLPERPGASACVQYELTGAPAGTVTFHLVLDDGRVTGGAPGPADDADFTMKLAWDDFQASLTGAFDPTVGFMRGEVKVVGNIGRMLSVLPVTDSDEWRAAQAAAAADAGAG